MRTSCPNPYCGMYGYIANGVFKHFVNGSTICPPSWVKWKGSRA